MRTSIWACLLLTVAAAGLALAVPTADMVATTSPPQLDGKLDDAI